MKKSSRSPDAKPEGRLRHAARHALFGMAFGYLVLHPVSMLIILLFSRPWSPGHAGRPSLVFWDIVLHSFTAGMLPMGVVFAGLSSLMAGANGFLRGTVVRQRDELRRQTDRLRELESTNRRTMRFLVHDYKNQLGAIVGLADLLLLRPDLGREPEEEDALERISRLARRVLGSVGELLALAKLKERPDLSLESAPVGSLVSRATRLASDLVNGHALSIADRARRCEVEVLADPALVERVLLNLVGNAIAHNPNLTRVSLDVDAVSGPGEVVFSCRDDGRGIPEDRFTNLFEEFEGAGGKQDPFHGLGLAFCREAIEAHGGRIWCEESSAGGTEFRFTLRMKPGGD